MQRKTTPLFIFILICTACSSVALSVIKYNLFPNHFFFDAGTIKRFMTDNSSLTAFDSYNTTAMFYKLLPGGNSVLLVSIFSMLICILIAWQVIYTTDSTKKITLVAVTITSIFFILASIFLAQHSKDFIIILLISSYIALTKYEKKGLIIFIGVAIVYAILFRAYWLIVIGFFVGALTLQKKSLNIKKLIASCLAMLLVLSIMFKLILNVDLTYFRTSINKVRIDNYDANANTLIENILPSGNILFEWINASIAWILLMFPFPLLKLFTLYHIASFILISFIFLFLFLTARKINNNISKTSFILIICFTVVQSIFEPDYGSFLRHITPLLPLFIFIYLKNKEIENKNNEIP